MFHHIFHSLWTWALSASFWISFFPFFFYYYYLSDAFINVIFFYIVFLFFFSFSSLSLSVFIQFHHHHKRRNNWIRIYSIHAYDAFGFRVWARLQWRTILRISMYWVLRNAKWCLHTNITNIDSKILYFVLSESPANISSCQSAAIPRVYDHHHHHNNRWYFYNVFLISRNVHRMRYVIHAPIPDTQSQNCPRHITYHVSIWQAMFQFLFNIFLFLEPNHISSSQNWFVDSFSIGWNGEKNSIIFLYFKCTERISLLLLFSSVQCTQ